MSEAKECQRQLPVFTLLMCRPLQQTGPLMQGLQAGGQHHVKASMGTQNKATIFQGFNRQHLGNLASDLRHCKREGCTVAA